MTQEEKNLLKFDLCCRLLYNVKVHAKYTDLGETVELDGIVKMVDTDGFVGIEVMYDTSSSYICVDIDNVKPYLFPMSSMTEEQKKEYNRWKHEIPVCHYEYGDVIEEVELFDSPESFKYLIENHFDYNGLIPIGLANDTTGLNIY